VVKIMAILNTRYEDTKKIESFNEDLKAGEESEHKLMQLARERGLTPVKIKGKFKPYDFFIAETKKAYEVKRDWKSKDTGNVVVEVEMYNKPSGLMATKADLWVFDLPDCFITIEPEKLKDIILQQGIKLVRFIGNGDTEEKRAYLVKRELIEQFASKITSKAGNGKGTKT
jgi:hypothetical protein